MNLINLERLREVEIFAGLADEELALVIKFCEEIEVDAGVTLCAEGKRADRLFILERGSVSIKFPKGEQFEISTPGKILGWSFLVPPHRYTASAITNSPSKLLVIKSPDFYEMVHQNTQMGLKIMDNLAQVVAKRMKTFVDLH